MARLIFSAFTLLLVGVSGIDYRARTIERASKFLPIVKGFVATIIRIQEARTKTVCYGPLGCFSNHGDFQAGMRNASVLPQSPETINTMFLLFTRDNSKDALILPATNLSLIKTIWTTFRHDKPTKFIIHGYIDDIHLSAWMQALIAEMLIHDDYNVIVVDWSGGNYNPYDQATANTRIVGAQVALLTQTLMAMYKMSAGSFHAIGHSLGAQTAGYAGKNVPGFGRISGLDPAGPYFAGFGPEVRLDPTDAQFVDSLHTDGSPEYLIGIGTSDVVGHADFYPNRGSHQPGCQIFDFKNVPSLLKKFGTEYVGDYACDHIRALDLYIESVNSKCPFTAFPCESAHDFENNKCLSCGAGCSRMGFHADKYKPAQRTKFYLHTSDNTSFCEYNIAIKVFLGKMSNHEKCHLKIQINGHTGHTDLITLNKVPTIFKSGQEVDLLAAVSSDIGPVTNAVISFEQDSAHCSNTKIAVKQINIRRDGADEVRLCTNNESIEKNKVLKVMNKCKA